MNNKLPVTEIGRVELSNSSFNYLAYFSFSDFSGFSEDIEQLKEFLHIYELEHFNNLKFERRIKSYLIGRYSAKIAISAYVKEDDLSKICILNGIFDQPVVNTNFNEKIQVSISHSKDLGCAICFNEKCPMGIDIEFIRSDNLKALERYIKSSELDLVHDVSANYEEGLYLLWTSKESLSKALKIGFLSPISLFEINEIENKGSFFKCSYKNFPMFSSISFIKNGFMVSITYPKKLNIKYSQLFP